MGPRTPDDEESADALPIPSFESLRGTRRRSAVDLLSAPTAPVGVAPPEWGDLWRLGRRVVRWWLRQPCATVRRLLG